MTWALLGRNALIYNSIWFTYISDLSNTVALSVYLMLTLYTLIKSLKRPARQFPSFGLLYAIDISQNEEQIEVTLPPTTSIMQAPAYDP